ncbi:zinc transporter 6 [Silurus asotus]|uniref:Zinc transporter 6 n=1 Tax=Silurus asotus TaxID=30991 RepID=A0AAD5B3Q4_SILAS|nr:zinc transporter 6 [Silurus asotus]
MAMDAMSTSASGLPYHHVSDYYPRKLGPKPDVVPSGVTERKIGPADKPDMVSVDVINFKDSDTPVYRKKQETDTYILQGTIHPFRKSHKSIFSKFTQEFNVVLSDRRTWKILLFGMLNVICTASLLMWCNSTNSMGTQIYLHIHAIVPSVNHVAGEIPKLIQIINKSFRNVYALTAYTYLTIFDLFSLITCLISSWVAMKKPSQAFTFGFERFEVLAVFASTVLIQLGALFILKESVERFMEQPEVHTGRLLVGTLVALFFNLLTLLSIKNKPFVSVSEAASTSWLQEHVADLSQSLCGIVPALSSILLPRMNPFVLINLAGAFALGITYMLIEINNYNAVDTASAVAIALMTFGTMYPMSVYSGKVLLQTTPSHVIGQLDKVLREVSTLDGVLEVRNEHFWTIGFGSLAGSVHVRIRRDANEQMVLAHVTNRLHTLVSTLTIQIFKDDWTRPSLATGPLNLSDMALSSAKQLQEPEPLTSTPSKPSSPPPEFSFNTPGRNLRPVLLPNIHQQRPYNMGLGYGPSPYNAMLSQGLTQPGSSFGVGLGPGPRIPSIQNYRTTFSAAPNMYGSNLLPSQSSHYKH